MTHRRQCPSTRPAHPVALATLAALAVGAVATATQTAAAQTIPPSTNGAGFDTHLFRPAMDSKGLFTTNGSDILGANDISFGLVIDYGRELLRIDRSANPAESGQLVNHSFQGSLQFNYGIINRFVLGLDLPIDGMYGDAITTEPGWNATQLNS